MVEERKGFAGTGHQAIVFFLFFSLSTTFIPHHCPLHYIFYLHDFAHEKVSTYINSVKINKERAQCMRSDSLCGEHIHTG